MSFSSVIGQNGRHEGLTYIIAHWDNSRVLRGYLEAFLNGGDGAIEVGICHGENAAHNAIEQNIGSLIGKATREEK